MLLIDCPFCGPRAQLEFRYGGQAGIARPQPPESVDDAAWAAYLYVRDNPKGAHVERWCHRLGCGLWFDVTRDTVTHRMLDSVPTAPSPEAQA
jgi:sarcosine oxidase subunit delta